MDELDFKIIDGTVSHILFTNIENGYTVFSVNDTVVTGYAPGLAPGEQVVAEGTVIDHPSYGEQFKAEEITRYLPQNPESIFRYLASGTIKGMGEATASLLVNKFGADTFEVLESSPERIAEIKGISLKKATAFSEAFREKTFFRALSDLMSQYQIRPFIAMRLYKYYGKDAIRLLKENPYILTDDRVGGYFGEADNMALQIGFAEDSDFRIRAAVAYTLRFNLNNGHCFIPQPQLCQATAKLLNADIEDISRCVRELVEEQKLRMEVIKDIPAVYLPEMYDAECSVARQLISRKKNIRVITGGPGTGKTTSICSLLDEADARGLKTFLVAPTGRAAKRMSEVTRHYASTIHRLLGASFSEEDGRTVFSHDESKKLKCDLLILDESSMIDLPVMDALLKALPQDTNLVLVGDVDQLPPVGPGSVFKAIIRSELFPTDKLTKVYRQKEDSYIVSNAHLINAGEHPDFNRNKGDFFRLKRAGGEDAVKTIVELCTERLPKKMNIPTEEIQVLTPTRGGDLGTVKLNEQLQKSINPPAPAKNEKVFGTIVFRTGDRVMQIRNDYDIFWHNADNSVTGQGIFNGDIGYICEISPNEEVLYVDFEGKIATYPYSMLGELEHAWAMTVHKSQGSEFRAVILALGAAPKKLMRRTVFYTAVTRARELLILVGDEQTAFTMIDNDTIDKRYSFLVHRMKALDGQNPVQQSEREQT